MLWESVELSILNLFLGGGGASSSLSLSRVMQSTLSLESLLVAPWPLGPGVAVGVVVSLSESSTERVSITLGLGGSRADLAASWA